MERQQTAALPREAFPSYAPREILVDAAIHAVGITLGLIGCATLLVLAVPGPPGRSVALLVYGASLMAMLVCSALYNLAPIAPRKALLRRLDHAAIYLLIAGTYTPFGYRLIESDSGPGLLLAVWGLALAGMAMKLRGPRLPEPWSSLTYVVLGWIALIAIEPLLAAVSPRAIHWLLAGGLVYTAGVPVHLSGRVPYQNAIWHAFVLVGAACHYMAVIQEFA